MLIPRDVVKRTVGFGCPDRLARNFPDPYGSDFSWTGMDPNPDARPSSGTDEWGSVWSNIGISKLGEVSSPALPDWEAWKSMAIPDVRDPKRWLGMEGARERAGDCFLVATGVSLYERAHFLRGLENLWADIYEAPERLCELLDCLVEMNLYAVERYAAAGVDGLMFCDDWGLQDRLMIDPGTWREFWKPRYARVYAAARAAGLVTMLHSCGYIVDILDDLIEIGLDLIHMDQQMNMGLETLGERFGGRLTFLAPVDIQAVMPHGTADEIRAYCRRMVNALARPEGGFIPTWYSDPKGAGHSQASIDIMCETFIALSRETYGA